MLEKEKWPFWEFLDFFVAFDWKGMWLGEKKRKRLREGIKGGEGGGVGHA